jgi:hypothetical protein
MQFKNILANPHNFPIFYSIFLDYNKQQIYSNGQIALDFNYERKYFLRCRRYSNSLLPLCLPLKPFLSCLTSLWRIPENGGKILVQTRIIAFIRTPCPSKMTDGPIFIHLMCSFLLLPA